jgi:hypothetical protein
VVNRWSDRSIETSDRYDLEGFTFNVKREMAWKLLQKAIALSSQGWARPVKPERLT